VVKHGMMFKDEMANLIDQGKKTATRRLSTKKFYKVGSIQPIQRNYCTKATKHIRILKRYKQKLRNMSNEDAIAEGFSDRSSYFDYLAKINKKHLAKMGMVNPIQKCSEQPFSDYRIDPRFLDLEPTVYEFCLIQAYIYKMPDRNFNDSDEYGFKKMLQDVINNYCCPECKKNGDKLGFFFWEDEAKGLAVCSTCGYKKQFKVNSPELPVN
jgi:ASC-1-like (ASCH) protein/Zn ribbon nucleic-acid-binding protein